VKKTIVSSRDPVTILGGGTVFADDLSLAQTYSSVIVAADSGAHVALEADVELAAVIGDMDSISTRSFAQIPPEKRFVITEQDSTDFDKALRHVETPLVIAVGFSGGCIDHQLAVFHTLVRRPDRPCLVLAEHDVIFLCPRRIDLPLPPRTRVSLFPLGPVSGRSEGLEWPIDGLQFAPGKLSGTSNRATGPVSLEMEAPCMLCILPRTFFADVIRVLMALPPEYGQWPARAAPRKAPPRS
jgi:thiamine pyrophosphokinase